MSKEETLILEVLIGALLGIKTIVISDVDLIKYNKNYIFIEKL